MADLHSLTIAFRAQGTLSLQYNSESRAKAAWEALKLPTLTPDMMDRGLPAPAYEDTVDIGDDFGTLANIDRTSIMAHWFTNLGQEVEGQKEKQILNAHAQANLQRRLATDPLLKGMVPPPPSNIIQPN